MRNLRRDLTWIGLAYVAYLVVSALSQTGTAMITSWLVPWIGQDAWMVLCIIFMYPLAFFLYCRNTRRPYRSQTSLRNVLYP